MTGKIRGACDYGWHIPSKAEWEELLNSVYATDDFAYQHPGNILRILGSDEGIQSGGISSKANDMLGFSVYPFSFGNGWIGGRFWAIDEVYSDDREVATFYVCAYDAGVGGNWKNDYRSVRCIKDED